ncbi:uncharacterized protein N7500_001274 [Penicillium coprophilum]|uniref:uncharacterized protein n=1 Tax=Penicillium coprophilum TaxID=36646 RepID=UPI00239AD8E2|nr:uncharacterized protein N7500_001274 [Penicillium coprophilum]KAJ5178575.1 hypothetical protein N7500_001274 [Penicillium coprophilum]
MSTGHPYHSLLLPRNALFELKPSPGKGWGAFATKHIKRGSLILREKALFFIPESHVDIMECNIFTAFMQLSPSQKEQVLLLRDNGSEKFQSFVDILSENSFAVGAEYPGRGLFTIGSRFNHSCLPNARAPITPGPFIEFYAIKDIEAGEEIYFCYNAELKAKTKDERREALGFTCDCKACVPGTPFQELSDLRRRLIRGILYIIRGVDLDGRMQSSRSPVIVNPELKAAAEKHNIPLSSKLVLRLLSIVLLEEEGLLDDWAVEIVETSMVEPVALFKSEENQRISQAALAQDTWLKKFQGMLQLYGREDPADLFVRMLQRPGQVYGGGAMSLWP